jgi:hypothetical protein
MPSSPSPERFEPPTGKRLALSVMVAALAAAAILVVFVLPAEYGLDPTGLGRATGITALKAPARQIEIADVVGGNETVREIEIPDFGEPVPLPNPEIAQAEDQPARTATFEITIPPDEETEIKTVLRTGKMILYTWKVDRGSIYSDFHGHNPEFGDDFFVRYLEHQEGAGQSGSLVAPFDGEHGWYWLNYNDFPVTVSLTVTGYYDDTVDYGVF